MEAQEKVEAQGKWEEPGIGQGQEKEERLMGSMM
jgi:hypothetical protein